MNMVYLHTYKPAVFIKESEHSTVPALVLNELWVELLTEHERCWGRIISNSMYPTIRRDDEVLVDSTRSDKVRFGDIVVFRMNGILMTHRALGKHEFRGEGHFLEKGDANLESSLVPAKKVIGRVTTIRNSSGTLQTISGSGRLLQLILACVSYTSFHLWAVLEYCLTRERRITFKYRYGAAYKRLFLLLYRITFRLFGN